MSYSSSVTKAETKTVKLEQRHIDALTAAETWIFESDLCPHIELQKMLAEASPHSRERFEYLFTKIFGLKQARLTDSFTKKYFEILFSKKIYGVNGQLDYRSILTTLYRFKGRSLHFSFVSKLVSIHDGSRPIYDKHVLAFFKVKAPAAAKENKVRIDWYTNFLDLVQRSYIEWQKDERIAVLISKIRVRDSRLKEFDTVRLMDFLVWTVGNRKLLTQ